MSKRALNGRKRLIVGVTGATGFVYAERTLRLLREMGVETHLVMSRAAELTREYESPLSRDEVHALADHVHAIADVGASISSGSFRTLGMLVVPCSMRTVGEIASGVTSTLLTRAADVVLKERLPLVLMVRETPLNLIHLRNMTTVTEAGAVVFPPVPAFYAKPQSLEEMVDHSVSRALDQFGLDTERIEAWRDMQHVRAA
ncbi:4-hydroxy-3-polyprenylbenzoate decarboxylase [Paraburkholderia bannensis]|uniref:Flavin prenyltransferase UbiX n=1 Tax=Paraburkholderia bannensis TaxID=765414 RepID=A0A7W9WTD6_9BURK|nr:MULTISPECIES: UbiX family flavin prenyltransferase [Burkholderiaceae]MBB3260019.1 4-hydroxy-3-polyprenylbenzoate decarboxylase [Paraburkholderia sp. WP4_3_2]MBB6105225.1 4-hydroxy-3-polyprenylbenzoate decarboxylase [Paraburkholderia bannensis]NIE62369.1 UbiX family flavin prenyltransferase [Burkholderia sp. Ax-1719]